MMPPDASLPGCLSHLCEVAGVRQLPAHLEANDDARAVPHLKLMTPQRGAGGKGRALGKGGAGEAPSF